MGAGGSLQTTRVSTPSGTTFTPPLEPPAGEVGIVPGGFDVPVEVWVYYWGESQEIGLIDSVQLRSMEAGLVVDGSAPISLVVDPVRKEPHVWALAFEPLPDSNGKARLVIELAWEDRCFSYAGTVLADVVYRSAATLASCTRDEDAGWEQLRDLFAAPISFGRSEAEVFAALANTIFVGTPIEDGPYGLVMFDRDATPHVAAPSESIAFASTNADLQLGLSRYATLSFYRRGGVVRHQDEGGASQGAFDPPVVATSEISQSDDGRFSIQAPTEPGRYVASVKMPYESGCSVGVAVAGPGLDVVAP